VPQQSKSVRQLLPGPAQAGVQVPLLQKFEQHCPFVEQITPSVAHELPPSWPPAPASSLAGPPHFPIAQVSEQHSL
jgi:hypothetical protein